MILLIINERSWRKNDKEIISKYFNNYYFICWNEYDFINSSVLADSHRFDYNGQLNEGKYPGLKAKLEILEEIGQIGRLR